MTTTLYRRGRLHARQPGATALLVEAGSIVWIGDEAGADLLGADRTVWLDDAWLAPAFVEGHAHLADTGLAITNSLAGATSAAHLQALTADLQPTDGVLLAQGWDDTSWSAPPTSAHLPGSVPSYVARTDLHSAVVNQPLASLVPGIERLPGWHPSGLVRGEAHAAARAKAVELLSLRAKFDLAVAGLRLCASQGIATVHEMAGPAITGKAATQYLVRQLADRGDLPTVRLWWGALQGFDEALALNATGVGGDLSVDGSLGSRTALLSEPYQDSPTESGRAYLTAEEIADHVAEATRRRLRVSFHAIGDAALDRVRVGFELAAREVPEDLIRACQHQVEHAILPNPAFLEASLRYNLAWSVQPAFAATWGAADGMYSERLGDARLRASHPLGVAARAGIALILGSDSPVTPIDPWGALSAASDGTDERALTPATAFRAHTATALRRDGEPVSGALEVGQAATFAGWRVSHWQPAGAGARWGSDPRARALPLPEFAARPSCLLTVLRGEVLYDAGLA